MRRPSSSAFGKQSRGPRKLRALWPSFPDPLPHVRKCAAAHLRYLDVALHDLQREFELARSKPRHLVPQPRVPSAPLRAGLDGLIDSLLAAQHVLEMFRRALPDGTSRRRLARLSNRLTKIVLETRKLRTP